MLKSLKNPALTAGGVLIAEQIGSWAEASGHAAKLPSAQYTFPVLMSVAGVYLARQGGVMRPIGQGTAINGMLHLASAFFAGRADTDLSRYA